MPTVQLGLCRWLRVCGCVLCRTRAKGEINGKSANLNNALKNIIYPEYTSKPGEIPVGELIVVFDADMQVRTGQGGGAGPFCVTRFCQRAPTV